MIKQTNYDPYNLKGIPDLGDTSIQLLIDNGIESRWDILVRSPPELADITGKTIQETGQIQLFVKRQLQENGLLEPTQQTAYELLQRRKTLETITTGSKDFDEMLGTGIECQSITEVYGAFRSGKTQLALTASVLVQGKKQDGGLSTETQEARVLYIDTENTFRGERILSIAKARGLIKTPEDEKRILSNIIVEQPQTSSHQQLILENAQGFIKEANIRLIVLDSATALFRAEYPSLSLMARRQQALNVMIHRLHVLAENNNLAVLFINQVYQKPDAFGGDVASGGNVVSHGTTYRIHVAKAKKVSGNETWKATMADSPMHDKDETLFQLSEMGIIDVKKPKKENSKNTQDKAQA